jgi:hypothetical protein
MYKVLNEFISERQQRNAKQKFNKQLGIFDGKAS